MTKDYWVLLGFIHNFSALVPTVIPYKEEGRVNAEEELKRTKKIVIDTLLHPYFEL